MRIETFNKICSTRNIIIATIVAYLATAILLFTLTKDESVTFGIALGVSLFFLIIYAIIATPVYFILESRSLATTIKEDRENNEPEYHYDYDDFNGDYWTIVTRRTRYGKYDEWQYHYNLINQQGQLFFTEFQSLIGHIPIPKDLTAFKVRYNDGTWNVIICDGYEHRDTSLLVDTDAKEISKFDSEGFARVTYMDDSVNYVNLKGVKLYSQNLIGFIKSPDFE